METNDRWKELGSKNRSNQNTNQIKYKNLEGFIPIYEKPGGIETGDLNFKLISEPASEKQIARRANSWERSKYFNIWMKKDVKSEKEIYITKLMNLLYQDCENLYKVQSPKKNNSELQKILIKFIPNVKTYSEFETKIQSKNDEEFNEIREKIDEKALLKLLISNFLIQNFDVNKGNILVKEKKDKIQLIPIDFSYFLKDYIKYIDYDSNFTINSIWDKENSDNQNTESTNSQNSYHEFSNKSQGQKFFNQSKNELRDFKKFVQDQNFKEAKNILLRYTKLIASFKNEKSRNKKIIQSEIDLNYQLNRISDEDFKEVITEMFSKYDEMKNMLNIYKKIIEENGNREDFDEIIYFEKMIDNLKQAINEIQYKPLNQEEFLEKQEELDSPSIIKKFKFDSLDEIETESFSSKTND